MRCVYHLQLVLARSMSDAGRIAIPYGEITECNYTVPLLRAPRASIRQSNGELIAVTFTRGSGAPFVEKLRHALDNYRSCGAPLRELYC